MKTNLKLGKFQNMWNDTKNTETTNLQSTQIKCYKAVAVPMLTYTSENWIINQTDKSKKQNQLK
jgi:hypothetical protein